MSQTSHGPEFESFSLTTRWKNRATTTLRTWLRERKGHGQVLKPRLSPGANLGSGKPWWTNKQKQTKMTENTTSNNTTLKNIQKKTTMLHRIVECNRRRLWRTRNIERTKKYALAKPTTKLFRNLLESIFTMVNSSLHGNQYSCKSTQPLAVSSCSMKQMKQIHHHGCNPLGWQ